MHRHLLQAVAAVLLALRVSAAAPVSTYNVEWLSATPFDGKQYTDGMPAGNGDVVVLAWGNTTSGGLDFFVRSSRAQHTDSTLFTIAHIQAALSPNPFLTGAYYNQTLHLDTGIISVRGGGTGAADYAAEVSLYVDANSNAVSVAVISNDGTPRSLTVTVNSPRPSTRMTYKLDFMCNESSTGPDTVVDPIPAPTLPADALALYHVNSVAGGDPAFFAGTLTQQALSSLLGTFADPLDGRIFGVGVVGAAGADGGGAALRRTSPTTLSSAQPAAAFSVLVAVVTLPDAAGNASAWLGAMGAALQGGPAPAARAAASAGWWSAFWARSYIDLPPTPPPPRVGVFPCDAANASLAQAVRVNASTSALTLADGRCFVATGGGSGIAAGDCATAGAAGAWTLMPCTASNCAPGEGSWVVSAAGGSVFDMPGAHCPWVDTYPPDKPTGALKNQLFAFNATDSTLRCLCATCAGQCVSAVAPPGGGAAPQVSPISAQYARTRFVQAVQSRSVGGVPIKFNGMLFTNQAGANGPANVDYRQWGSDNWWQNTRLPYGNMLAAGDFDSMRVILDWAAGFIPLALARTAALLPGEEGIYFTETVTSFGLFQQAEYGCSGRPEGYPPWLENSGWVQFDFGGNALGPEAGLMALDYYLHTGDLAAAQRYVPLATHTVDFYASHFHNRTADGKFMIWPTQVLETYWCSWPGFDNCCVNDLPQLAGLTGLLTRLLALPAGTGLLTPSQRTAYAALLALLPPLPLEAAADQYAPAEVVSSGTHNSEVPQLYGVHPFRLVTAGRAAVDPTINLTTGINTWNALPLAKANTGWYYGGMDAALLGMAQTSFSMVYDRATQPPAGGYRFPAFAQHYQDYEPSADHFANHNTALQLMLLQLADDGYGAGDGTMVLFPAWPCDTDVSFKLWGPFNTTVEVVYANATLVSLDVQPPARASAVKWAACVPQVQPLSA